MTRDPVGWDVDSPVQAEVFVVWLDGDRIRLTGPDGPQAWLLQLGLRIHNMEATRDQVLAVLLADDGGVEASA